MNSGENFRLAASTAVLSTFSYNSVAALSCGWINPIPPCVRSAIWLPPDWSDLNRVVLTTTDSNAWGGASGHTYIFTRQPNGTTDIDLVVVREGKNLKGRVLGFVLRTIGRNILEKAFENSVKTIEARNQTARLAAAA
jgi:hypothetical protein